MTNSSLSQINLNKDNIEHIAANPKSIQPKGTTLLEHKSKIRQPYILKHDLRE